MPAQGGGEPDVYQLGYLLGGDRERAARLVAAVDPPTVESLVRAWLAEPDADYGPGGLPALGALAPRRRAAVVLRHWAGLPAVEVARILDRTPEEVDEPGEWSAQELGAAAAAGTHRRRGLRAAVAAVGVLAVAAVLATVLGVGSPDQTPEAEATAPPSWVPGVDQGLAAPTPGVGAVVIDARARRLTDQLARAVEHELPELARAGTGPSGPLTGYTERPPLEFYTRAETTPPGAYFAQAVLDARGEAALLLLEVWRAERAHWVPRCHGFERDCAYREFPDRTRAEVEEFVEPTSGGHGRRVTALRPDGTFTRVTAYGPVLGLAEMFRFASIFSW